MHKILVNRLVKSVVRSTEHLNMTIDVNVEVKP